MQILFLFDKDINTAQIASILDYHKSLQQNILCTESSSLYEKDGFIYAHQCLILNTQKIVTELLLSPSLIIDLSNSTDNIKLESYLGSCWVNAQQAFYHKEIPVSTPATVSAHAEQLFSELATHNKVSHCVCYTDNNEKPSLKVFQESIKINSPFSNILTPFNSIGLMEQAVTEYFSDNNFFTQIEWPRDINVSQHQSMVFSIQFDILEENADYSFEIKAVEVLTIQQVLSYNKQFVYDYFDNLLKYRLDRYIEQVKFRTHIIKLCEQQKIDLEPSYYKTFILTKGLQVGVQRRYYGGVNDKKGISIINNKHKTNLSLKQKGFKTNASCEYSLADLASKKAVKNIPLDYPLVIKPTDKKEGYAVVTNIKSAERMLYSVKKLVGMKDIDPVVVEEFFPGITYRVLVVAEKVVAVLKFIPANIVGDGKTTIDDLIRSKNLVSKSRIRINNALRLSVFNDGKRWETILAAGEKYILSHNSHASTGGQSTNVTEIFDQKYKHIACQVCKSLGLKIAGIDMIVNDDGDYRILEINCGPALATHVNPKHGTSIATYSMVLKALLEKTDLSHEDNRYLPELLKFHH